MHLYVVARAQHRWLDDWVANLSTRYYLHKYDKDKPAGMVQLSVRPIQLYEIVFPEPALNQVLSIVQPYDGGNTTKKSGLTTTGKIYKSLLGMSRLAGLKKIPVVASSPEFEIINPHRCVGVTGVGLKKDIIHHETGIEML